MMKVIIIEDEKKAASLLENMLLDINPDIEIADKCYDLPSGIKSIRKYQPDLVFLDVKLPTYSGLQLLDFFNEEEIDFSIIFTTASSQHAVQAFEMSAIDYLLKPIDEDKLKAAILKYSLQNKTNSARNITILKENLQTTEFKKIIVSVAGGFEIITIPDILYLKAEGSYTKLYLINGQSITISKNLKYFDSVLESNHQFFRVHRSYIANIQTIKRIIRKDGYCIVMEDESQVPIIPEKVEELIQLINQ
jgi:two-component system LytT family response regulator